jgi:mRNA interferase RelE/StbE
VGKPLDEPFDGFCSTRRGTHRVDVSKRVVGILSIRHRRGAYRR